MPYQIHWEPQGVYRRYYGHVLMRERRLSLDEIAGDPRFDAIRYAITDSLEALSYEVDPVDTEETAALHIGALRTNPRLIMAAVAVDPAIIAAIQHFMALDLVRQPYRIFPTVAAARRWIARHRLPPV